jgi:hypothetical protein
MQQYPDPLVEVVAEEFDDFTYGDLGLEMTD